MEKKYYILGGILILLLALAGVLFFVSSGPKKSSNNGKVELTWWKPFETTENLQDLINDYQTSHKNVTITYVKKDVASYEQELVDALASGQGPDIFSIHNDWLPKHLAKLAPIPQTTISLRTYKDNFVDVAYDDFVKDSNIYAVPLSVDVLALYYNKDILHSAGISQPPTTWPELVLDVQKITKVSKPGSFDRSGIAMGTSTNVNRAVDIMTLLMLQNGTEFYSSDLSRATFDQQNLTESQPGSKCRTMGCLALEYYTQFSNPAKNSYTWNVKSDFSIDAFTQGKVAMMLSYEYLQPIISAKAPNLNWEVASVPQIDDTSKVNFANYWGEAISKASTKQEAAADFLNFISSKNELNKYYSKHKVVASRKDILPDQLGDLQIGVFAENALTAKSVYKKDDNVYEGIFLKMIDDVVLNNLDPEDALRNAAAKINLNLQNQ